MNQCTVGMSPIVALYMVIICIVPHYTEEIFYDDCSSFVGWTKTKMSEPSQSEIYNMSEVTLSNFECESQWCFQIEAGNVITSSSISIRKYNNVTLQYSIKPFWLEDNDFCKVYYTQNNKDWTLLTHPGANTNNIWQNIIIQSLPVTTSSDYIKLRFYVSKNNNESDSCFIDEIHVFGTHTSQKHVSLSPFLTVGIIILASIGFFLMICFCKMLSEHVDSCTDSDSCTDLCTDSCTDYCIMACIPKNKNKNKSVASVSVGGTNLSFLDEEKKYNLSFLIQLQDEKEKRDFLFLMRRQAEAEKYKMKMDQREVENLRNINFAQTKRLSGIACNDVNIFDDEMYVEQVASNSTLNLEEVNEKLRYHIQGLKIKIPTDVVIEFEETSFPTNSHCPEFMD